MNDNANFPTTVTSRFEIAKPLCAVRVFVGKGSSVCRIESFCKLPWHRKTARTFPILPGRIAYLQTVGLIVL